MTETYCAELGLGCNGIFFQGGPPIIEAMIIATFVIASILFIRRYISARREMDE